MNPNFEDRDNALDFEMVLSGIKGKINMIEFAGKETDENLIKQAFELGQQIINQICDFQMEVCKAIGKRKVDLTLVQIIVLMTFFERWRKILEYRQLQESVRKISKGNAS